MIVRPYANMKLFVVSITILRCLRGTEESEVETNKNHIFFVLSIRSHCRECYRLGRESRTASVIETALFLEKLKK